MPPLSYIGNQVIVEYVAGLIQRNAFGHAYLFSGVDHVGKMTLALRCAGSLICQNPDTTRPLDSCGVCGSCVLETRFHPDVQVLSRPEETETEAAKKNISIDQVRAMQVRLSRRPIMGQRQVVIIQGAEALSAEAANALLKTLEEPPVYAHLILLTRSPRLLPSTLVSRCQRLRFLLVADQEITTWLLAQGLKKPAALLGTGRAAGRPGIAWLHATAPAALAADDEQAKTFVAFCLSQVPERFSLVAKLLTSPSVVATEGAIRFCSIGQQLLGRLVERSAGVDIYQPLNVVQSELDQCLQRFSGHQLLRAQASLTLAQQQLRRNGNPRLVLEQLALTF